MLFSIGRFGIGSATMNEENIAQMFSDIAPKYDLLNRVFSFGIDISWRRKLIGSSAKGLRICDVCTGTGDVAVSFAQQDSLSKIVGVDFSSGMLQKAGERIRKKNFEKQILLIRADALNLPLKSGWFDISCISFGLRNISPMEKAISEMARVLKAGGQLRILEFCPPEKGFFLRLYKFYLTRIIPLLGALVVGKKGPHRYLASSICSFLKAEEMKDLLRKSGFGNVVSRRLTGGIAYIFYGTKR